MFLFISIKHPLQPWAVVGASTTGGGCANPELHRLAVLQTPTQRPEQYGSRIADEFLQLNQPSGVPPLPLTGERTLPDVPEENYWYRRHLVVYEWIAGRVAGKRVV